MSRLFNGTSDQVQWDLGACNLTGAYTLVSVIKLDSGVTWQSYIGNETASSGSEVALGRNNSASGGLGVASGGGVGGFPAALPHSSADGWILIAGSRPAGADQTVRVHVIPIGGTPSHADATGALIDNAIDQDAGVVVFGQIDGGDFFKGRMVVCAEWAVVLSDGQIESLVTNFTREDWLALAPVGLWDEYDAFATDRTENGADLISLSGTTDDADDPAGWEDWEGAAPPPAPSVFFSRSVMRVR